MPDGPPTSVALPPAHSASQCTQLNNSITTGRLVIHHLPHVTAWTWIQVRTNFMAQLGATRCHAGKQNRGQWLSCLSACTMRLRACLMVETQHLLVLSRQLCQVRQAWPGQQMRGRLQAAA